MYVHTTLSNSLNAIISLTIYASSQDEGLENAVHNISPIPPFLEAHSSYLDLKQREVPLLAGRQCDEAKLAKQLEVNMLYS